MSSARDQQGERDEGAGEAIVRDAAPRGQVIAWGEVLWDLFPDGRQLGGAPANVAVHLAALGRRVSMVTRVGADPDGAAATAALAARGVDVSLAQIDDERATGVVEVALDGGEARYRLVPDRAWERIALTAEATARLATASALCFGTLSQRSEAGLAAWRAAIAATPPGVLRVCDPNLRGGRVDEPALRAALAASDVIKLNEREVATIGERLGVGDAVDWLIGRGVRLVAVTRGERGCCLHDGGLVVEHTGFPSTPGGDNVGCGDAFTAVVVHGLLASWPLERIASAANRYAAAVASQRGGTPRIEAAVVAAVLAADAG